MSVCCCSLAGTAACKHCRNNPFATDLWTNTVTADRIDAKPFGNGIDVCPVCGKPYTIGKPLTHADRIRAMSDEELAEEYAKRTWRACPPLDNGCQGGLGYGCTKCWLDWLKSKAEVE